MAWKQAVGRWHWGQLIIALFILVLLTVAFVASGSLVENRRQSRLDNCEWIAGVVRAGVWRKAAASDISRRLDFRATTEQKARRDSVAKVADSEAYPVQRDCESDVGSEMPAYIIAGSGLLFGGVTFLTILWIWFGARRPEARR